MKEFRPKGKKRRPNPAGKGVEKVPKVGIGSKAEVSGLRAVLKCILPIH
jgi:hypothetical protein